MNKEFALDVGRVKFIITIQSGIGWLASMRKSETKVFPAFLFARNGAGAPH